MTVNDRNFVVRGTGCPGFYMVFGTRKGNLYLGNLQRLENKRWVFSWFNGSEYVYSLSTYKTGAEAFNTEYPKLLTHTYEGIYFHGYLSNHELISQQTALHIHKQLLRERDKVKQLEAKISYMEREREMSRV